MRRFAVTGLVAAALLVGCRAPAEKPKDEGAAGLKDETRMPWTRPGAGFLRNWLVCGEFPNPPHEGARHYDHTPPCVGLDTDYLADRGGEAAIQPVAGMTHTRPDGCQAAWGEHTAPTDTVDFRAIFKGRPTDDVVAYAYTTVERERAGESVAPGGKIVAEATAARGAEVRFSTKAWPDGPFEIRASKRVPEGSRLFHHLPWYKGDWLAQVRPLLDACDALAEKPTRLLDARLRVLGDIVLDRLGGDPRKRKPKPGGWKKIHSPLIEYLELAMGGARGSPAPRLRPPRLDRRDQRLRPARPRLSAAWLRPGRALAHGRHPPRLQPEQPALRPLVGCHQPPPRHRRAPRPRRPRAQAQGRHTRLLHRPRRRA